MFSGGDIRTTIADTVKFQCGGAFKKDFTPDDACKQEVESVLVTLFQGMDDGAAINFETYVKNANGQAKDECRKVSEMQKRGLTQASVGQATQCISEYHGKNPTRRFSWTRGTEIKAADVPAYFSNWRSAMKKAAELVKRSVSLDELHANVIPLPQALIENIETWKKVSPLLAKHVERLFREAMKLDPKADAGTVADQLARWANQRQKSLMDNKKNKQELEKLYAGIAKGYVTGITDGDLQITIAPSEAFGNQTDPGVVDELRRLFVEALQDAKGKGGGDKKVLALKTYGAAMGAMSEKHSISDFRARVVMKNGKLDHVEMENGAVGVVHTGTTTTLPRELVAYFDAADNDRLKWMIARLWDKVLDYFNKKKKIDLNDAKKSDLRAIVVESVIDELKKMGAAENALYVYAAEEKDGKLVFKTYSYADKQKGVNRTFTALRDAAILHQQTLINAAIKAGGKEDDVVTQIDEAGAKLITEVSPGAYFGSSFDGFTDDAKKKIKPLKYSQEAASTAVPKGLEQEFNIKIGSVGGAASLGSDISYTLGILLKEKFRLKLKTVAELARNPAMLGKPSNEGIFKMPGSDNSAALPNLSIGLEHEGESITSSGEFGWLAMGDTLLGGKFQLQWKIGKDDKGKLIVSLTVGTPHTLSATDELEIKKQLAARPEIEISTPLGNFTLNFKGALRTTVGEDPTKYEIYLSVTPKFDLPWEMEISLPASINIDPVNPDVNLVKLGLEIKGPNLLSGVSKRYKLTPSFSAKYQRPSYLKRLAGSHPVDCDREGSDECNSRIDIPGTKVPEGELLAEFCLGIGANLDICGAAGLAILRNLAGDTTYVGKMLLKLGYRY